MYKNPTSSASKTQRVWLDGQPVALPASRRSLNAIRTYLETLALENERVLCHLSVDGRPANISQSQPHSEVFSYSHIEAKSVGLTEIPLRMLETALTETAQARTATELAITLVLINDGQVARELWWDLARKLKVPLLTLSLLPETIYQTPDGCASLLQIRKWQLQQLATIMKDVDEACWADDCAPLSNALENRVLPWLDKLEEMIQLWRQTVLAGARSKSHWDRDVASIGK